MPFAAPRVPLIACKLALGPLLLAQGRRVRREALRLPEPPGPREGALPRPGGGAPLRVLVLGDSSAAGVGAGHQAQALGPRLAREVAHRCGRPVHWQLIARSGVDTAQALAMLEAHATIAPADVVVTALGVNDVTGQVPAARFGRALEALLAGVRERSGAERVVLTGVPPMQALPAVPQPLRWYLGQCARRLDAVVRDCAAAAPQRRYLGLQWAARAGQMAADGFHPGPLQYAEWARRAAVLVAALAPPSAAR